MLSPQAPPLIRRLIKEPILGVSAFFLLTIIHTHGQAFTLAPLGNGWPGYERSRSLSVAVDGNRAYLGGRSWLSAAYVLVLDITDPSKPELLGHVSIEGDDVGGLVVRSNLLYVAARPGSGGMAIVDVSDPTQPLVVGTAPVDGWCANVALNGNYAYTANDRFGYSVIDIADPTTPVTVTQQDAPNSTEAVSVLGNLACLAGSYAGISILDVSVPTNPVPAGFFPWAAGIYDIELSGHYVFAPGEPTAFRSLIYPIL